MKKVLIIIKREYLVRVRTKAFMIGTIISPLLMLGLITLPIFFATRGGGERRVTVLDQSGDPDLFDAINRTMTGKFDSADELNKRDPGVGNTTYRLTRRVITSNEEMERALTELKSKAASDPDATVLVLRPGPLDKIEPEYYAKNTSDFSIGTLERALNDAISGL